MATMVRELVSFLTLTLVNQAGFFLLKPGGLLILCAGTFLKSYIDRHRPMWLVSPPRNRTTLKDTIQHGNSTIGE